MSDYTRELLKMEPSEIDKLEKNELASALYAIIQHCNRLSEEFECRDPEFKFIKKLLCSYVGVSHEGDYGLIEVVGMILRSKS